MNKCKGCGINLQTIDNTKPGFILNEDNHLCQRCFNITNYNNHEIESNMINNDDIIKKINSKKIFTLFLIDFLSLNKKNIDIYNSINNEKILIITKADIIPKNITITKLEEKIKKVYKIKNLVFFSIKNDTGKKQILNIIDHNKKVLLCGPTNGGKSSLINYLYESKLTVSNYKNTTQDFVSIMIGDVNIIDAPGFNDNDIIDNIKQSGYIKPKTVKLNKGYILKILDYEFYSLDNSNVTVFLPNNVLYNTYKQKEAFSKKLVVNDNNDLIINNIGFIHFKNRTSIFINKTSNVEIRDSLIG